MEFFSFNSKPENENSNNEPTIVINKATKNDLECVKPQSKTWIKSKDT